MDIGIGLAIIVLLISLGFMGYRMDRIEKGLLETDIKSMEVHNLKSIISSVSHEVNKLLDEAHFKLNADFNQRVTEKIESLNKDSSLNKRVTALEDRLKRRKVGRPRKIRIGKDDNS